MHIIDRILDPSAQLLEAEFPKVSQGFISGSCSNPQLPYCWIDSHSNYAVRL